MATKSVATFALFQKLLTRDYQNVHAFLTQVLLRTKRLVKSDFAFIGVTEVQDGQIYIVIRDKHKNILGARVGEWDNSHGRFRVGTMTLPRDERSFTGYVAATKRPLRAADVTSEAFFRKGAFYQESNRQIRSEIAVPILLEDEELLGVINLESKTPGFYAADDERTLQLIARLIAPRLFRLVTRDRGDPRSPRPTIDSIIAEIDRVPVGILPEVGATLSNVARRIARALDSRSCTIWLLDDAGDELVLRGACGPHIRFVHKHRVKRRDPLTLPWKVISEGLALRFGPSFKRARNVAQFDRVVYGKTLDTPFMIAPILSRGRPIGVIKVGWRHRSKRKPQGTYSVADEELLLLIQSQLGACLHAKRLEESRRLHISDGARLASDLAETVSSPNLDMVLQSVVERIPQLCSGTSCSIFMWSERQNAFVLQASTGLRAELIGEASYQRGEGLTGWVGATGKSLNIVGRSSSILRKIDPQLKWAGKFPEGEASERETRAVLAVPIFRESQVVGVMRIGERSKPGGFSEADEQLLNMVASYISAMAMYQNRYQDRLDLLETLEGLFSQLNKCLSASVFDGGVTQFRSSLLDEAALAAVRILHADVLTLYAFNRVTGEFEFPPVIKGNVQYPDFMVARVQREEVPWVIMRQGTTFWSDVRKARDLVGRVSVRDVRASRPRFAIREKIVSAAGILLQVGLHPVGVLFVSFRTQQNFESEKRKIITMFAAQVALFMEVANTYWSATESVARETAEQLALDLHDSVLQTLNSVVVARAGTSRDHLVAGRRRKAIRELTLVERAGYACVEEIRGIMDLLGSHVVDDLGLSGAVQRYCDLWKSPDMEIQLQMTHARLPTRIERHLYRVVQTTLGNVVRHARASHVEITLKVRHSKAVLAVSDDGVGFDVNDVQRRDGAYGLKSVEKRARILGGKLAILSQKGKGTTITVAVPV